METTTPTQLQQHTRATTSAHPNTARSGSIEFAALHLMQVAVTRYFSVGTLLGNLMIAALLLSACGARTETVVPEAANAPTTAATDAEFPNCRMREDVESFPAEGYGYSTAHDALAEFSVNEFPYDIFVVVEETGNTVVWEMRDARNTRTGEVTAHKSTWGWVVSYGVWCVPSRDVEKLNLP